MPKRRRPTLEDIYRESITRHGRTDSLTDKVRKSMERDQEMILRFMSQRDMPPWFRGTSVFQVQAADDMLNALRDDLEQGTSYRVHNCLSRIGITPIPGSQELKDLMKISQANDLAFLWFIREMHYKTEGPEFSVNEQLIYTSIAHLDMITTLRELDRILPSPQDPKKRLTRKPRDCNVSQIEREYRKEWRAWKAKGLGPYWEPLKPPTQRKTRLSARRPDFEAKFPPYEVYEKKTHIVANERNRWFTNYELQPGKRIVFRLIDELINNDLFDDLGEVTDKYDNITSLCEHHKVEAELEKLRKTQKKVDARDRCLQHIDVDRYRRENRLRYIQATLNQQVDRYRARINKRAGKVSKLCAVKRLANDSKCAFIIRDNFDVNCISLSDSEHEAGDYDDSQGSVYIEDISSQLELDNIKRNVCKDVHRVIRGEPGECSICNPCLCVDAPQMVTEENAVVLHKKESDVPSQNVEPIIIPSTSDYLKNYNYAHSSKSSSPASSKRFFQAPSLHRPYNFDHDKIFYFNEYAGPNINIKNCVAKAIGLLGRNTPEKMDAAVLKYAVEIWKEAMEKRNDELAALAEAKRVSERLLDEEDRKAEEARRYMTREQEARFLKTRRARRNSPLKFNREYYDPDDTDLMDEMLREALDYMKQNHKFVLPCMPDAHKMPMLRLWIAHRFGKRYHRKDIDNALRDTVKIMKALEKMTATVPPPTLRKLGKNFKLDYTCHGYVRKKANMIKKKYYDELCDSFMEQSRVIWFAIQPYMFSTGPPTDLYFSYFPDRVGHIMPFRPWKKHEFKDAKSAWNKRQLRNKKESF